MNHVAGFADGSVTWLLVLFGFGMVGGNLVDGRYADRALMPMLYVSLGALAVVLALFTLTAHHKILEAVTIVLIGALGFATVPPLQKRVLDQAHGASTLASAVNFGAFNLGNALSAWLGGMVIAVGLGYTAPNWVGAALAAGRSRPRRRLQRAGAPGERLRATGRRGRRGRRRRTAGCCPSLTGRWTPGSPPGRAPLRQPAATVSGAKRRRQSPGNSGMP
ncbi:MFS family permease [Streptomyces sp. B4I13]|nr:MFS family permease [Streptomyces sp. B4I13]